MDRYEKQRNFEGIGHEGQDKLKDSSALIIGCGALGTVVANSLVRSGVGHIKIVDRDFVELSNLQRQTLFDEEDAKNSVPKAEAARKKLMKVNSTIKIETFIKDVNSITIEELAEGVDIILDCTDNFQTRYLINDLAFHKKIPWVYGGVIGSTGVVKAFIPQEGGCLRCMMTSPPPTGSLPTCDTAGVVNTITGIVALHQSNEAIKYLTGHHDQVNTKMKYMDIWENTSEEIQLPQQESCICCIEGEYEFLNNKKPDAEHMCGRNSVQILPRDSEKNLIDLKTLFNRLEAAGVEVNLNPFLLNIKVEEYEIKVFDDGRAIIKNAETLEEARAVYAKYIGS